MEFVAYLPMVLFCSDVTGSCVSLSYERTQPTFEACEIGIQTVLEYKTTLERAAKLPPELYLVHKECYAVFE